MLGAQWQTGKSQSTVPGSLWNAKEKPVCNCFPSSLSLFSKKLRFSLILRSVCSLWPSKSIAGDCGRWPEMIPCLWLACCCCRDCPFQRQDLAQSPSQSLFPFPGALSSGTLSSPLLWEEHTGSPSKVRWASGLKTLAGESPRMT